MYDINADHIAVFFMHAIMYSWSIYPCHNIRAQRSARFHLVSWKLFGRCPENALVGLAWNCLEVVSLIEEPAKCVRASLADPVYSRPVKIVYGRL